MSKNLNLILMLTHFSANDVTMVKTHFNHTKMIMFSHRYLEKKNGLTSDMLVYSFEFFSSLLIIL